jgi:hypothetical protein
MRLLIQLLGMAAILLLGLEAKAVVFEILEPAGDKYMYPFITDPTFGGDRDYASTFGAYGSIDDPDFNFDDRDAQFFLDFDTRSIVAPGQGAANYQISQLVVTVVVQNNNAFFYDPTPDALSTYTGVSMDGDPGRPIELYGVGYRSGWAGDTFNENSPFQTEPSSSVFSPQGDWNRKRNAFAMDFNSSGLARDVSNNVEENFETNPWAVADSPGFLDLNDNYVEDPLLPGGAVAEGRVLRFIINVSNSPIRQYLQQSFDAGRVQLMVSSLMGTSQGSTDIPRFYTKESTLHDPSAGSFLAAQLYGEVSIIPAGIPPVPKVSVSRLNPSGFRVSFETQTGYQYVVESRDSIASGNWSAKSTTFTGTGGTQIFDDTEADLPVRRFYRVAVTANTP